MPLSFEIAGAQIDGAREYQEDAFLITHLVDKHGQSSSLIVVADGMGGHAAGNIASNMAVQSLSKQVTANYPSDNLPQVLKDGILKANHSITEMIKETPALDGMGCTLIGVLLQNNQIWWASVGDSHLYLLRNRELTKLNADHSYGGFLDAMQAAGTPIAPEPGLSRNMLMSALTGGEISDIDCPSTPLQLQAGDKILLCSDGVNTLSNGKIIQYCEWSESPKECVEALLTAVEDAEIPKQDNTTTIAVYVVDKAATISAPAPAATKEADEDITDPSAIAKSAVAATDEEATGQSVDEQIEIKAPPEPLARPPRQAVETAIGPKPGKKIIMALAAGIIIAVAIGAYFKFGSGMAGHAPVPERVTTEPEVAPGAESGAVISPKETPAQATEPATSAITEMAPVEKPVATTKPKTEPAQEVASAATKVFQDTLKDGSKGPEMVWLPAGSFAMGSPGTSTSKDERPRHNVKLKKFAVSKYEITISEYEKFAQATKRTMPDDLYMEHDTSPVVLVKWDDAFTYAKWLSEQTGHKYRIPSEAEWEYAASGGQDAPFWWGYEEKPGKAHCFNCGSLFDPRKPAKIGKFQPNQFGLYDTAGNVSEWVYDCWHESYEDAPTDGNAWEGGDCSLRVARGGSYISPQQSIRMTKRDRFKSNSGYDHIGIRLARDE
jgi:formylglycine-generating enzyme required for sulfatase activity/serine/threonine protein phosphatase PrpC